MRIAAALARIPPRLAFWVLAGVALLASHDAVFLTQVGPGELLTRMLREAGHGYWGLASLALGLIGLTVAIGAWVRLRGLQQRAAELGAATRWAERSRLLVTWARLFAVVTIGFLIQENVEHSVAHLHLPGIGALLGPEYPLALPVITLISGIAALMATAVGRIESELVAAIAEALRHTFGRGPRRLLRPPQQAPVVRISVLARSIAGRAPPRGFAQLN